MVMGCTGNSGSARMISGQVEIPKLGKRWRSWVQVGFRAARGI